MVGGTPRRLMVSWDTAAPVVRAVSPLPSDASLAHVEIDDGQLAQVTGKDVLGDALTHHSTLAHHAKSAMQTTAARF